MCQQISLIKLRQARCRRSRFKVDPMPFLKQSSLSKWTLFTNSPFVSGGRQNRRSGNRTAQSALAVTGDVKLSAEYGQRMKNCWLAWPLTYCLMGSFSRYLAGLVWSTWHSIAKKSASETRVHHFPKRVLQRKILLSLISLLLTFGFTTDGAISDSHVLGYSSLVPIWIRSCFYCQLSAFQLVSLPGENSEAIGGISNIFITGSCFVGGVFVSANFLPDIVNKIAAFTPTYWFVQNNTLISETLTYNQAFTESFWFNGFVLVAFAAVFSMLQFILGREGSRRWQYHSAKINDRTDRKTIQISSDLYRFLCTRIIVKPW